MLTYESEVLVEGASENKLFVFAKGIELNKVFDKLFHVFAIDTQLVFVLSASPGEETYFLEKKTDKSKMYSITSEFNAQERKEMYAGGGLFFITARILVVDFLKDVVPADKITGIIVFRAHNVLETSQEAFILRLYRTKNKTGFIRCFSHSPTAFLLGFSHVSNVMRSSFLANLSLWPRSHISIKESLKESESDPVVEIHLKLTEEMREIQTNLLDLVTATVSELKRLIPALNVDEVTTETALTRSFEKIVKAYVDPIWNTIDAKSKELLNDIKIFRLLLAQLTKSDCVSFYSILSRYTSVEAGIKGSGWLLSNSADRIIAAALKRLKASHNRNKEDFGSAFDPEVHPKWIAVGEIIKEINTKLQPKEDTDGQLESPESLTFAKSKTVIYTENTKTCNALRDYLTHGRILTLARIAENCDNLKLEIPPVISNTLQSIFREEKRDHQTPSKSNNSGSDDDLMNEDTTTVQITLTQIERKYKDIKFLQTPVFVLPLNHFDENSAYEVSETLEKLRPDNIIIFDPNLELIRNIEIYRARVRPTQLVAVYFLVFRNSIEEQIYLNGIHREKMAFEKLIQDSKTMLIPNEREGKDELNQDLLRDPTKASETVGSIGLTSRRNMENKDEGQQVILVDMREFRSELPSLIHKRGIDLEPLTLDVGDYILTPDICVERKSISDLIGSLNSGRLYKQTEAMGRHYKKPVLLIEHEQKSGSFRHQKDLSLIMPKLQLLTIHFPKLRIIWSPGAYYSSEIFHELKKGKPQPSTEAALAILKDSTGSHSTSKYNPISHAFLSNLPGVDSKNIYTIMNRTDSLDELSAMSVEELSKILENSTVAATLYEGLHSKLQNAESIEEKGKPPKKLFKLNAGVMKKK